MSEATPERGAPLSAEERAEQVRLAKERAAAARAARLSDGGPPPSQPQAQSTPAAETPPPPPAAAASREPVSASDRAEQIRLAKERAAAAHAARESGTPVPASQPPATAAPAPASETTPAPAQRAAPASPEERAAAVEAAKERATAARAAREAGGTPVAPTRAGAPRPTASPEDRAAAVAQAQERAAAIRAQRATAGAGAATATAAPAAPVPTWRVGPNGVVGPVATALPEQHAQELAAIDAPARMVLRRRDFLRGGFWAGLGVLAVGGLATFLDFFNPRDIRGFGGIVNIPAANIPKPGADPFHYLEGKLWLVNLKPGEGVPDAFRSFAPPSEKGGLLALYHKCVHLGCTVPWRPDFDFQGVMGWFRCPCHGSTYTKGGVRVFGPAPRSLDSFDITKVDQNGVSVNTGKITLGNATDPQRTIDAGPYKG